MFQAVEVPIDLEKEGSMERVEKKIYPQGDEALIVCDHCGKLTRVNIARYKHIKQHIRVKCSCTFEFYIFIEKRRFYRKPTHLTGEYIRPGPGSIAGYLTVCDLSRGGIGFETSLNENIRVNDTLAVRFILDDFKCTEIRKQVLVKYVRERFIGAAFRDPSMYDCDLGFYLMFN